MYAADNDTNPGNDVEIDDFPVSFSADKGFFSTDTEDGADNVDVNDLVLDNDNDDEGDLFGFYEDLGANEEVSTGDDGEAGIYVGDQGNDDFDDDGHPRSARVTVTAGGHRDRGHRLRLPRLRSTSATSRSSAPPASRPAT